MNGNVTLPAGDLSVGSFADYPAVPRDTLVCLPSLMLQDRAKRAVARLPLLTEVPLAVCVSHPQRSRKDLPKPSWAWQAAPPSKGKHSVLLLHHCSCCRPWSEPLIILRIYFLFPECGLYTPVWCSIPCDCSHYRKPQSDSSSLPDQWG